MISQMGLIVLVSSAKVIKLSVILVRKVHVGQWDRVSNGTVTIWTSQSTSRSYRHYHLSCGHLFEMSIITEEVRIASVSSGGPETLYHRDDALLYIAYVLLIWAAPIPADRWHCSLWS